AAEEKQAELQGQVEQLQGDVAERDQKLEEMLAAQKDLEERYADDTRAAEEKQAELQGQIEQLQSDLGDKEAGLENAEAEHDEAIKALECILEERDQEIEELLAAQKELEERYADDTRAAQEKQAELQGQIEQLQSDVAERDQKLEELLAAQGELLNCQEKDACAAQEKQAELLRRLELLENELQATEKQMQDEISAYEAEVDDWRYKLGEEQRQSEEQSAEFEGRITELGKELRDANRRIEELRQYMVDVEQYVRGAYQTTLEGFCATRQEALEMLSLSTTSNMNDYKNAMAARVQLMAAVDQLQQMLEDEKRQAEEEIDKLRSSLAESKSSSRNRLKDVIAFVRSAQGFLVKAVEVGADCADGNSRLGSPEPRLGVSVPLGDHSNKENNAKRSSPQAMLTSVGHAV
ncbi:putative OSM3-like kinesin, partial [Trypanosoma rangeli]